MTLTGQSAFTRCSRLVMLGLGLTAEVQASTPPPATVPIERKSDPRTPERVLDGHVFFTPTFLPSPFVTTHFSFRQGVVELAVDGFPLDEARRVDARMYGLTEHLELGVRLFERFELFVFGGGTLLSGIDVLSALALGSNFAWYTGGGVAIRLFRLESTNTQLSVRMRAGFGSGGLFDLLNLADALSAGEESSVAAVTNGDVARLVLKDTYSREAVGHVLLAQALTSHLGIQGGAGLAFSRVGVVAYDDSSRRTNTAEVDSVEPAASVALDANAMPWVPVGLLLEYSLRGRGQELQGSGNTSESEPSHLVAGGVHLAHPHFQLGVTVGQALSLQPLTRRTQGASLESAEPSVRYAQLAIHFTW